MREKINITHIAFASLLLVVVAMFLTVITEPKLRAEWQHKQLATVITAQESSVSPNTVVLPENIKIEAKGAIVYDMLTHKVLFAKNINTPLPLASVTKLVTALAANTSGTKKNIIITHHAIDTDGDSGLLEGDTWKKDDLSDYMLTVSSNDAAVAFADNNGGSKKFIDKMNKLVKRLGLEDLYFINPSGLDVDNTKAGAYGSPKSIALLLSYIVTTHPRLLESTRDSEVIKYSLTGKKYQGLNTDKIVDIIPNLVGGKTGYTDLAGGNLAIVFDKGIGHYIAIVVLGSSKDGRFTDVLRLASLVLK